jgi:hypothetical protein
VIDGHVFARLRVDERIECLAEAAAAGVDIAVGNLTLGQQAKLAGTTPPTLREARRAAGAPIRGYNKKSKRPKPATPYTESPRDGLLRVLRGMGSKTLLEIAASVEREELAARSAAAARATGNGAAHP